MPPPGVCLNIMEARQKQDGYGSFSNPDKFFNQDYQQLKQYCVAQGVKYIDDTFPPDRNSIGQGILKPSDVARVVWLRPEKIAPYPAFVLDGVSRFDFAQGLLGNCWFLASIGALTFQNDILGQVVPLEQTFDEKYCGLFHFRFWRFGRWMDVVIDDKLPTINGKLIFVHSKDQNEFWPALLEKAYAKVCGSYTDMNAGTPAEAMMDFTGGVHMCINLSDPPCKLVDANVQSWRIQVTDELWHTPRGDTCQQEIAKWVDPRPCLHCNRCETDDKPKESSKPGALVEPPGATENGLETGVIGHLCGKPFVLKIVKCAIQWMMMESFGKQIQLNIGNLSKHLDVFCATHAHYTKMTLEDFCKFYTNLDICSLYPDFLDGHTSRRWKTSMYEGRWVAGTTAGGCMNNKDSFWTNPQFRVKIDDEHSLKDGEKNMLISLMQKSDKRNRHLVQNLHIGFTVFEVKEKYKAQKGKFPASFFSSHAPVAQTKTFMNARDVMEFLLLKPGEYLIVPSTFNPNEICSFILTILSRGRDPRENSTEHKQEPVKKFKKVRNVQEDENKKKLFRQYSDKLEEVDAEQLQRLLNENILKGDLKSGGFSIDACRSMVALMDTSITGKLNSEEFVRLWRKVVTYKDIFFHTDVSRTGTLSLSELRNAFLASGISITDDMLNLMALRYGASSGHMTLESFISLILRLDSMYKIFKQLSNGKAIHFQESEWIWISMYS